MPGEAHLAAVVVLARRFRGCGVEVGVLEDDEGPLAAELGGERDQVLCCGDPDQTPRLG